MGKGRAISPSMEDYLKAIYKLSSGDESVSTSEVAKQVGCAPASVTNMLQKLSSLRLVDYTRYKGVKLTQAGRDIALEIIRHHRLIELYLSQVLGYSWDKVHEEADRLEHVISEEMEAKMDEALGHPETDPHGDPIPTLDGRVPAHTATSLWETQAGVDVKVKRVSDGNPEVLRYLADIGICPQVRLRVKKRAPFNGPVCVKIGEQIVEMGEELARQIFVETT